MNNGSQDENSRIDAILAALEECSNDGRLCCDCPVKDKCVSIWDSNLCSSTALNRDSRIYENVALEFVRVMQLSHS